MQKWYIPYTLLCSFVFSLFFSEKWISGKFLSKYMGRYFFLFNGSIIFNCLLLVRNSNFIYSISQSQTVPQGQVSLGLSQGREIKTAGVMLRCVKMMRMSTTWRSHHYLSQVINRGQTISDLSLVEINFSEYPWTNAILLMCRTCYRINS